MTEYFMDWLNGMVSIAHIPVNELNLQIYRLDRILTFTGNPVSVVAVVGALK